MPAALARLLTCPAALRVFVAQRFLSVPSLRGYASDAASSAKSNKDASRDINQTVSRRYNKLVSGSDTVSYDDDIDDRWHPARIAQAPKDEQAKLWAQSLAYKHRLRGFHGIKSVYFMMLHTGYRLPTDDTREARAIWWTLLKNAQLVLRVIDHAAHIYEETGQMYPHLYELCMGRWLRKNPDFAMTAHHRLVHKLPLRKLPLRRLAQITKPTRDETTLAIFMDIYRTSNERDVYDEIVPALCDQGEINLARRWHYLCTHRKDLASSSVEAHPIVQLFIAETSVFTSPDAASLVQTDLGTVARHLDLPSSPQRPSKSKFNDKLNEELIRRLEGRDTAPIRFDDPFCARLFATRAFSPASIIKGLILAGVNEIGPEALRQMGLRTNPVTELPQRFRELREAGIALHGCVFSLALEKFALEGRFGLVRSILQSDQHPDVFDDANLQKELLTQYLAQEDRMQAHRTLAILALFHNDVGTESWNILLQARIKQFYPKEIVNTLEDMRDHGIIVSEESMKVLRTILRPRNRQHNPDVSTPKPVDDLRFLARCYMLILESGIGLVYPTAWCELIRRFGILGRLRELRRLLFWLLYWYAPRDKPEFARLLKPPFLDSATGKIVKAFPQNFDYWHTMERLFSARFQRAIVVWGFRSSFSTNATLEQSLLSDVAAKKHYRSRFLKNGVLRRLDWSVGLRTLAELRDLGVPISIGDLRRTLWTQFYVLFRRGRLRKRQNQEMRIRNELSLSDYIRQINKIWGIPLFREVGNRPNSRAPDGVEMVNFDEATVPATIGGASEARQRVVGSSCSGLEELEEMSRKQSRRRGF